MGKFMVILSGIVFLFLFRKIFFYAKDLNKRDIEYKPALMLQCALYATMFGAFGTFAICASIYTIILLLSGEGHLG